MLETGYYRAGHDYAMYRAHGTRNWLLTFTVKGHGLYRQPGLTVQTNPGDLVLVQPGALHDYCVPSNCTWEFLWAHFQPRPTWLSWWHLPEVGDGLFVAHLCTPRVRERAHQAFLKLHADAQARLQYDLRIAVTSANSSADARWYDMARPQSEIQHELVLHGLEEVFLLAVWETGQRIQRPLDHRVQQVLDLISHDLASPRDLCTLARAVGLSPSRLAYLFKAEVGDSVMNMVLMLRLSAARHLLESTSRPIGAIAEDVGFNSPFYFSRQFRRYFGMSPRTYRAGAVHTSRPLFKP